MLELKVEDIGDAEITVVHGDTEKVHIVKFEKIHRLVVRRVNHVKTEH